MTFDEDFRDRGVVITGACGVFGRWIARAFLDQGARLCLSDNRADRLAETAAELGAEGAEHLTHATELTDAASIAALVEQVRAEWGAPDIVINNAGVYPSGFLLDIDADEWDRIFDVNTRAPFLVAQGFARTMIAQGRAGSIINISSGAARKMRKSVVPYCTSKTALDRLSRGLALELAEYGIRVNLVEPGFAAGSEVSALTQDHVEAVTASIPLGRASRPEDATNAIMFLCSDAASYITGANLAVDGGNSIGSLAVYQSKKTAL
ncbi:oxidoreductase [Rhodobacteraceae bacterium WD3A24]|nr:oxidoreductase [Rhodobacteraceae bacterium WD3A24]